MDDIDLHILNISIEYTIHQHDYVATGYVIMIDVTDAPWLALISFMWPGVPVYRTLLDTNISGTIRDYWSVHYTRPSASITRLY